MKILWHSNAAHYGTGYGQQTALFVPRIASLGHEVAISAFCGLQGVQRATWQGHLVYPGGTDSYGGDVLAGHAADFGADLVITLLDAWVLDPAMVKSLPAAACWLPVDCTPLSLLDREFLRASWAASVAMSEFGKGELETAGFAPLYVPHGIDVQAFSPLDKAVARQAMNVPQDAFVIGINGTNLDAVRKAFPEQMYAFALFRRAHPDAVLLIHAHPVGPGTGVDLRDIASRLDISGSVRLTSPYRYAAGGYTQQEMAAWYACLDLYSGCSYAEGFGLPLLEAQAMGVPVVATDFSAMTEVAGPRALLVPGEPFWNARHRSFWSKPSIPAIAAAYKRAYENRPDPAVIREHALKYDADLVLAECWKPALDVLEASLG